MYSRLDFAFTSFLLASGGGHFPLLDFLWNGVGFNYWLFYVAVKTLIDQEVKNGIPSNRIILGGFSQVKYCWKELHLLLGK